MVAFTAAAALAAATAAAVGASIYGAKKSAKAIDTASAASQQATSDSNVLTRNTYDENKSVLSPYINQGVANSNHLNALLDTNPYTFTGADLANDPGYKFRLGQVISAVNQNRATSGLLKSGSALKALNDYAQGQASQEFAAADARHQQETGNYVNALGNQQGVGLAAGSALAGVGQNYVNNTSANNAANANTQGNAALAGASQTNNLIGQGVNALSYFAGNGGFQRGSSYAPAAPSTDSTVWRGFN